MVTVGQQPGVYSVSEEVGTVSICVMLIGENIAEFGVPVTVSIMDITATGKWHLWKDYVSTSTFSMIKIEMACIELYSISSIVPSAYSLQTVVPCSRLISGIKTDTIAQGSWPTIHNRLTIVHYSIQVYSHPTQLVKTTSILIKALW